VILAALATIGLAALLYMPWWIGAATFDGLLAHRLPNILPSTSGVLSWYLVQRHSVEGSALLISAMAAATMILVSAALSLQVVDLRSLFRATALTSVAYLLLAPVYWPWYVALPIALLALTPTPTFVMIVTAFSVASRLAAPLDRLRINGLTGWYEIVVVMTAVGLWLPLVILGAWAVRRHRLSGRLASARNLIFRRERFPRFLASVNSHENARLSHRVVPQTQLKTSPTVGTTLAPRRAPP
jgi:hypothetical protein